MKRKNGMIFIYGFSFLLFAGCTVPRPFLSTISQVSKKIEMSNPNVVRTAIPSGTQATVDNLKIGATAVTTSTYTDSTGKSQRGPTAKLWLSVKDKPELDRVEHVYQGAVFEISNYRVTVDEITEGKRVLISLTKK